MRMMMVVVVGLIIFVFLGSARSHTLPGSPQSLGRERDKASSSGCDH